MNDGNRSFRKRKKDVQLKEINEVGEEGYNTNK
jgi:hypothetical protein